MAGEDTLLSKKPPICSMQCFNVTILSRTSLLSNHLFPAAHVCHDKLGCNWNNSNQLISVDCVLKYSSLNPSIPNASIISGP